MPRRAYRDGAPAAFMAGPWAQRGQARIMQALEVVEGGMDLPAVPPDLGPPWVCQHYPAQTGDPVYAASRYRLTRVVTAR